MEEEKSIYPVVVTGDSIEEVSKVKRNAPPAHYSFKIESFSLLSAFLSESGVEKYDSRDFEVAGYKWKLSLYPNGDSKRNGSNHISVNLVLSKTNNLPLGSEVNAFFKLFVYDQIRDQYLTVQDISKKPIRFHAMKPECGFSKFLPLATFNDVSSGYLVNDCCIFGAEVFVTNCTGKGESLSIEKPAEKVLITHTMENFSKLENHVESSPVKIAGYNWYIRVYPTGERKSKNYLSLFVGLKFDLFLEQKVWVHFNLRVKNQVGGPHIEFSAKCWFDASNKVLGYPSFIHLNDLKDKSKGYIVKDTLIVEAEIIQIASVKDFS